MEKLGGLLGWLSVIFMGLTISSFLLKLLMKNGKELISKIEQGPKYIRTALKYSVKYHKVFGYITLGLVLSHLVN